MGGTTRKHRLLTGTVFGFLLFLPALNGCKNFMNDTQPNPFMDSIEEAVWDATAPQLSVLVQSRDTREGITSPNGRITVKQSIAFGVQFTVDSSYGFVRWMAYDASSGLPVGPEFVQFANVSAMETQVTINVPIGNYLIQPFCDVRPSVERSTPTPYSTGVLKNVPISVFFYTPVDPSSFIFGDGLASHGSGAGREFKNITITGRGNYGLLPEENYAQYFDDPQLSADGMVLTLRPSGMLADLTLIKLTLNREVRNPAGVAMASEYSLSYTTGTGADTSPPELRFVGFAGIDGHPLPMPFNPGSPTFKEDLTTPAIVQRRYTTHIPMAIRGEDAVDGYYLLAIQISARTEFTAEGTPAGGSAFTPPRYIFTNDQFHPFVAETLTSYSTSGAAMYIDFPITTLPDGVVELSIVLYDQNDTPSDTYKFSVIKDTLAPDIETPANLGVITMASSQPPYVDSAGKTWFGGAAGTVTLSPAGNPSLADVNGYSSSYGSPRPHSEDVYWNFSFDPNTFNESTWVKYSTTPPNNTFGLTSPAAGSFTLYARFRDDLGNTSASKEVGSINIDGLPPVLDPWIITREGNRFKVALKASDTGSGLKEFELAISGTAGGTNPTSANRFAEVSGGGTVHSSSVGAPGNYSTLVLKRESVTSGDITDGETFFEFDLNNHLVSGEGAPAAGPISGDYAIDVKVRDNVLNVKTESASAVSGRNILDARKPVPQFYTVTNGPETTSPDAWYYDDGLMRKFFINSPNLANNFRIKVRAADKDPDTGGSGLEAAGYLLDRLAGSTHTRQAIFRPVNGDTEDGVDLLLGWPNGTLGYAGTDRRYMEFEIFFRDQKGNIVFYPSDNLGSLTAIPPGLLSTTSSTSLSAGDPSYDQVFGGNRRFRVYYDGSVPILSASAPNVNEDLGSGLPSWHPALSGVTVRRDRSGNRVFVNSAPLITFKVEDTKSGSVDEASGVGEYLLLFGDDDNFIPPANDTRWTPVPSTGIVTIPSASLTGFPDAETGDFAKIYIFFKDNAGNIGPLGAGQDGNRPYIHWPTASPPEFASYFLKDAAAPSFTGLTITNAGPAVPADLNASVINRDNVGDRSWFDITFANVLEKGAGVKKIRLKSETGTKLGITGDNPGEGYININGQDVHVAYTLNSPAANELVITLEEPLRFTPASNLVLKHTEEGQGISLDADPLNDFDGRTLTLSASLEDDMGLVSSPPALSNTLTVDAAPPLVTLDAAVNPSGSIYTSGAIILKGKLTEKAAGVGSVVVESSPISASDFSIEGIRFGDAALDSWTTLTKDAHFTEAASGADTRTAVITNSYPYGTNADFEITVFTTSTVTPQGYKVTMDDRLGREGAPSDLREIQYDGTAPELTGAHFTARFTPAAAVLEFSFKETVSGLHKIYLAGNYFASVTNGTVLNGDDSPSAGRFDYEPGLEPVITFYNAGVPKSTGNTVAVIRVPLTLSGGEGSYTVSVVKARDYAGNEQTSGLDFPAADLAIVKDSIAPAFTAPSIVNDGVAVPGYSSGNVIYTLPFIEAGSGLAELQFETSGRFGAVTEISDGGSNYVPGSGTGAWFSYTDGKITFTGTILPKTNSGSLVIKGSLPGSLPADDGQKYIELSSAKDAAGNTVTSSLSVSIIRDTTAPSVSSAGLTGVAGRPYTPDGEEFVITMSTVKETGSGLISITLTVPSGITLSGSPVAITFDSADYFAPLGGSAPDYIIDGLSSFNLKPNDEELTIKGLSASASDPGDTPFTIGVKPADRLGHEASAVTSSTLTIDKTAPVLSGAVLERASGSGAYIVSGEAVTLTLNGVTETGMGLSSITLTPSPGVTVTGVSPNEATVDGTAYTMSGGGSPGVLAVINVAADNLIPDNVPIVITGLTISTAAASDIGASFTVNLKDKGALDSLPVSSTTLTLDRTAPVLSDAVLEKASGSGVYIDESGEAVKLTLNSVIEEGVGLSSITLTPLSGVTITEESSGVMVDGTVYTMTGGGSPGAAAEIDVASANLAPSSGISIDITGLKLATTLTGEDVSITVDVVLTDKGSSGSSAVTSGALKIDTVAPAVSSVVLSPLAGSYIADGSTTGVSFTVAETGSGLKTIKITSSNPSDVTVGTGAVTLTHSVNGVLGSFPIGSNGDIDVASADPPLKFGVIAVSGLTVTGQSDSNSSFQLNVQLTDRMDNTGSAGAPTGSPLVIDRLAPSVASASLARVTGTDTWVTAATPIKVTLNTLADAGGVTQIVLTPTAGISISAGSVTAGSETAAISGGGVIDLTTPVTSAASFVISGLLVTGPADAHTSFDIGVVLSDNFGNEMAPVSSSPSLTFDTKGPVIGLPSTIDAAGKVISGVSIDDTGGGYTHGASGFVSLTGYDTTNDSAVSFTTTQSGSAASATYTMATSPFAMTASTPQVIRFTLTLKDNAGNETAKEFYIKWDGAAFETISSTVLYSAFPGWLNAGISAVSGFFSSLANGPSLPASAPRGRAPVQPSAPAAIPVSASPSARNARETVSTGRPARSAYGTASAGPAANRAAVNRTAAPRPAAERIPAERSPEAGLPLALHDALHEAVFLKQDLLPAGAPETAPVETYMDAPVSPVMSPALLLSASLPQDGEPSSPENSRDASRGNVNSAVMPVLKDLNPKRKIRARRRPGTGGY